MLRRLKREVEGGANPPTREADSSSG